MTRTRLPNRRPNQTTTLVFGSHRFAVTIGFCTSGGLGEVFASGAKSGCDLDYLLDDACVALSLLLQHGVAPVALAASMGRTGDGHTPASVIGALADHLVEVAAESGRPCPENGGCVRSEVGAGIAYPLATQSAPRTPVAALAEGDGR